MKGNYSDHYPPGADDELARREREQARIEKREQELYTLFRDDPHELANAQTDHVLRLGRILGVISDFERGKLKVDDFHRKVLSEYHACMDEAIQYQLEREGMV